MNPEDFRKYIPPGTRYVTSRGNLEYLAIAAAGAGIVFLDDHGGKVVVPYENIEGRLDHPTSVLDPPQDRPVPSPEPKLPLKKSTNTSRKIHREPSDRHPRIVITRDGGRATPGELKNR